jgi:hypothetical protein
MDLNFNIDALRKLVEEWDERIKLGSKPPRTLYEEVTGPGFWLVGDSGVYIMPNWQLGDEMPPVVYADECNPETLAFDTWWAIKRATFGGDDGCDFIELESIRTAVREAVRHGRDTLAIALTPETMEIKIYGNGKEVIH